MKESKKLSTNNFHVRIKNNRELTLFNECMDVGKFNTFNDLFNLCLEISLPQILESPLANSSSMQTNFKKMENKIVSKIDREFKIIKKEMAKQLILSQISEDMISTLLQSFLYFLKTQSVEIDEIMIRKFAQNLPDTFAKIKDIYIKNILID
jgi:hypothetical protein